MSNTRYLEIDSTYRDRNLWPIPGSFEILISQSGRKFTAASATDPVCNSTPVFSWTSNRFNVFTDSPQLSCTVTLIATGVNATDDQQTFIVNLGANTPAQQLDNYYVNAVARNTTSGEERRIVSTTYLGVGGAQDNMQITVQTSFSSLTAGDIIQINDPTELNLAIGGVAFSNPQIFVPAGRYGTDAYSGNLLYNETRNESRKISGYDLTTNMLTLVTNKSTVSTSLQGPVTTWTATDSYSIRPELPLFFTNSGGSTTTTVVLTGGNSTDNFYTSNYLRVQAGTVAAEKYTYTIYPTIKSGTAPVGEISRIIAYNGTTKVATLHPALTAVPQADMNFEVLMFSHDNLSPFIYTGSQVSQQEMVCYEIELLNLILPNRTLSVGQGNRIAFYPYVYVELSNVSGTGSGIPNSIYSNNPNSTRMIFRAAISDIQNPVISTFVKIDGGKMTQTLKFKPNDNLRFSVRLPTGEIFETDIDEFYSPSPPNQLIQISALFGLKRLS